MLQLAWKSFVWQWNVKMCARGRSLPHTNESSEYGWVDESECMCRMCSCGHATEWIHKNDYLQISFNWACESVKMLQIVWILQKASERKRERLVFCAICFFVFSIINSIATAITTTYTSLEFAHQHTNAPAHSSKHTLLHAIHARFSAQCTDTSRQLCVSGTFCNCSKIINAITENFTGRTDVSSNAIRKIPRVYLSLALYPPLSASLFLCLNFSRLWMCCIELPLYCHIQLTQTTAVQLHINVEKVYFQLACSSRRWTRGFWGENFMENIAPSYHKHAR